jgi:hypothetical protein
MVLRERVPTRAQRDERERERERERLNVTAAIEE